MYANSARRCTMTILYENKYAHTCGLYEAPNKHKSCRHVNKTHARKDSTDHTETHSAHPNVWSWLSCILHSFPQLLTTICTLSTVSHTYSWNHEGFSIGTYGGAKSNHVALICVSITTLNTLSCAKLRLRWTISGVGPEHTRHVSELVEVTSFQPQP